MYTFSSFSALIIKFWTTHLPDDILSNRLLQSVCLWLSLRPKYLNREIKCQKSRFLKFSRKPVTKVSETWSLALCETVTHIEHCLKWQCISQKFHIGENSICAKSGSQQMWLYEASGKYFVKVSWQVFSKMIQRIDISTFNFLSDFLWFTYYGRLHIFSNHKIYIKSNSMSEIIYLNVNALSTFL